MELKKLNWFVNKDYSYKNMKQWFARFHFFNVIFYIDNWSGSSERPIIKKNVYFVYFYRNDKFSYSRRIQCQSLEEAKQKSIEMCFKMIRDTFFEPPVERKILFEKCKRKASKRKTISENDIRLLQNLRLIAPAEPINDNVLWGYTTLK